MTSLKHTHTKTFTNSVGVHAHSRERQRMMKEQSPRGSASPATADSIDSSLKPAVELKLSEAELKLSKHR